MLFTYEAMPRGTVYMGQVDFDNLRFPEHYPAALNVANNALKLGCELGLGGMTTRGFGRMCHNLVEITQDA